MYACLKKSRIGASVSTSGLCNGKFQMLKKLGHMDQRQPFMTEGFHPFIPSIQPVFTASILNFCMLLLCVLSVSKERFDRSVPLAAFKTGNRWYGISAEMIRNSIFPPYISDQRILRRKISFIKPDLLQKIKTRPVFYKHFISLQFYQLSLRKVRKVSWYQLRDAPQFLKLTKELRESMFTVQFSSFLVTTIYFM